MQNCATDISIMHNQNEVTAKTFDEYKESYSDTVNDSIGFSGLDVDFFTRVKADYLVDICTKHFGDTKDLSLIDIGCGIGNFDAVSYTHLTLPTTPYV